jgi:CTP-dependent riboflavin kinase
LNPRIKATFRGIVRSGLGTGASYVSMQRFFGHLVKFLVSAPFPGKLNIQLDKESLSHYLAGIPQRTPMIIPASLVGVQELWRVSCYRISIRKASTRHTHEKGREMVLVLGFEDPMHPRDVVDVVSPVHLRLELGLQDGDAVAFVLR